MAVAVHAVGTPDTGTGTSKTPALPSTKAVGDLMVAFLCLKSNTTITKPADWNLIGDQVYSTTLGLHAYWKAYAPGDANPTFSWTGNAQSGAVVVSFSGCDLASPIDVAWASSTFAAPSTPYDVVIPDTTVVSKGGMSIGFIGSVDDNSWAKQTATFTALWEGVTGNYGNAGSFAAAYRVMPNGGAAGVLTERETNNAGDAGAYATFGLKYKIQIEDTESVSIAEDKTVEVAEQPTLAASLVSSVIAVIEALLVLLALVPQPSESISIAEEVNLSIITEELSPLSVSVIDSIDVTEYYSDWYDEISISEEVTAVTSFPTIVSDSVTIAESIEGAVSSQPNLEASAEDDVGVTSEELTVSVLPPEAVMPLFPSVIDSISIADTGQGETSAPVLLTMDVSDSIETAEDVFPVQYSPPAPLSVSAIDTVDITEYSPGWWETVSITEQVTVAVSLPTILIDVSDSVAVIDSETPLETPIPRETSDSVAVVDVPAAEVLFGGYRYIDAIENVGVTDVPTVAVSSQSARAVEVEDVVEVVDEVAGDSAPSTIEINTTDICEINEQVEAAALFYGQVLVGDDLGIVEEVTASSPQPTLEVTASEDVGIVEDTVLAVQVQIAVDEVVGVDEEVATSSGQADLEVAADESIDVTEDVGTPTVAETLFIDLFEDVGVVDADSAVVATPGIFLVAYIMRLY